jgi:hypothetical protein
MADLESVDAGQVDIEDQHVVWACDGHPERVLTLDRHVGEHPYFAQSLPDQRCQLDLVLDDQHSHGVVKHPRLRKRVQLLGHPGIVSRIDEMEMRARDARTRTSHRLLISGCKVGAADRACSRQTGSPH